MALWAFDKACTWSGKKNTVKSRYSVPVYKEIVGFYTRSFYREKMQQNPNKMQLPAKCSVLIWWNIMITQFRKKIFFSLIMYANSVILQNALFHGLFIQRNPTIVDSHLKFLFCKSYERNKPWDINIYSHAPLEVFHSGGWVTAGFNSILLSARRESPKIPFAEKYYNLFFFLWKNISFTFFS